MKIWSREILYVKLKSFCWHILFDDPDINIEGERTPGLYTTRSLGDSTAEASCIFRAWEIATYWYILFIYIYILWYIVHICIGNFTVSDSVRKIQNLVMLTTSPAGAWCPSRTGISKDIFLEDLSFLFRLQDINFGCIVVGSVWGAVSWQYENTL